ncbi:hypothetical protein CcaverHIS002_0304470 [Cutaneotrichosporon cavernicola]|uniref:Cytoplasmic protein n=1 Tax=Cutaneotrichosporon cavernicola TaxID=279322 RepID=A0AA48I645_9TREE|nr:uncharacterized protein CcaverHIS019_0304440 [Cutaneotrichosporon cavernicola]BEI82579.1 hypothetical protein CcaverHIS002_0304470 [Cutaneotrichosporon cavernicola]BEI90374.1 hypothetical protein CcaverHIS019_0304440 [Cutaneotrichosporon cavernicola]BEI98150.1 hypothetical protein CcaverHIS631_0304490 [Cutaneotrichosporon cavernicola]BEJ05927.1 hypothetical protein CcaverHIS641_0304490 [Cutaneotrichosporon cavernicola]
MASPTSLVTELRPVTSAVLTVRIIKNFPFRTAKNLVLRDVDLTTTTVGQLMDRCRDAIKSQVGFKHYRTVALDTIKKYTVAHGHKSQNLIINLDNDEWILSDLDQTLADAGCENETELSFFNRQAYDEFKAHPETRWD